MCEDTVICVILVTARALVMELCYLCMTEMPVCRYYY